MNAAEATPPADVHPGLLLQTHFLQPHGITAQRLAVSTGLSEGLIQTLLRGERGITVEVALKLGRALNTGPEFWLTAQARHDLRLAEKSSPNWAAHVEPLVNDDPLITSLMPRKA